MQNSSAKLSTAMRIEMVFDLYRKFGQEDYIGEPVSQIEHMSQAAQIAEKEGYEDEVILAAFFHDIGHLCVTQGDVETMEGYGVLSHEKIGADFLRELGFPEKIAKLVENHVQAKRYLTYRQPEYFEKLSEASRKTLEFQGGKMNEQEAVAFETDPLFELSLKMRTWDEMAKEEHVPLPDLAKYIRIADRMLS
ncbi:phosphonate degradation operons associated HDIG domain protein [Algoriphagus locisalis]|uniref:Phosphonate degradation operons associated HDIG domain protein n=1 Tax=Algoriphagus locisalis TaxID=305507 RepID=A0A1I6XEG6_9BACT|nr:phosphonate degradation HD-domain oxygenase [Algoriphagus locisalis]SFT36483.1 phosphonate degradation operons associated HDIG domain protein [Algoriphagus locisalis]